MRAAPCDTSMRLCMPQMVNPALIVELNKSLAWLDFLLSDLSEVMKGCVGATLRGSEGLEPRVHLSKAGLWELQYLAIRGPRHDIMIYIEKLS